MVFHGRIEDFFHGFVETMNFINEQYVPVLHVGEDGTEITNAFNGRTRCRLDVDVHLARNDRGKGGFSQAWRTIEENVFQGLLALLCRIQENAQLLLDFFLSNVFF